MLYSYITEIKYWYMMTTIGMQLNKIDYEELLSMKLFHTYESIIIHFQVEPFNW